MLLIAGSGRHEAQRKRAHRASVLGREDDYVGRELVREGSRVEEAKGFLRERVDVLSCIFSGA